jgi:hypothetical protein
LYPATTLEKEKRECFIFKRKETKSMQKNEKLKNAKMK